MTHWFACLSHEQVEERWPRIRELLEPVMPKTGGEMEVDDVLHLSEDGEVKIAIMGVGDRVVLAIVMRFVTYPRMKALHVTAMGGSNLQLFADNYIAVLIDYARDIGADYLQACCGDAEARLFRRAGKKVGMVGHKAYSVYRMGV